jgi:orotate phosphoribosyltransferase
MAPNVEYHERLRELISRKAVIYEQVELSSGGTSHYYIDCRVITTDPEGAFLVAETILDMLAGEEVAAVGGPTMGADPIVGAVCYASQCRNRPIPGFLVRKAPKKHGMQKMIEGHLPEGRPVVVVEDVVTKGGSVVEAIEKVKEAGGHVTRVIAIVDRMAGGREAVEATGCRFTPIFTLRDLDIKSAEEVEQARGG